MLFKRNIIIDKLFCQQDAVLEVNSFVSHAMSKEKGFASDVFGTSNQIPFLQTNFKILLVS